MDAGPLKRVTLKLRLFSTSNNRYLFLAPSRKDTLQTFNKGSIKLGTAVPSPFALSKKAQRASLWKIPPDNRLRNMRKILGLTRYVVFIPAVASIIGALVLMGQGSIAMIEAVVDSVTGNNYLKVTIVEVLTAVDAILLGTVLLVIGYGLYELFVDTALDVPVWLEVKDLDDLKSKLIGVVVAIIAVIFVGVFVDTDRANEVVSYGLGAGALVTGLAIFAYATKKPGSPKK